MMTEVMGAAVAVLEERLDQRFAAIDLEFKVMHRQLVEVQADTASCLDRLDRVEVDNDDFRKRFNSLDKQIGDVKSHLVKVSREQMRDRTRYDELSKRIDVLEQRKAT